MAPTLYTFAGSFRAQKILIAAQFAGVEIDVNLNAEEAKNKSPLGKTPVLSLDGGENIFESNAIARYVARLRADNNLYGGSLANSAMVDSWIDFSANEIEVAALAWVYPILGWMSPSSSDFNPESHLKAALKKLDTFLQLNTYLAGRTITLADIAVVCALALPMKLVLDAKARKAFPAVVRWFTTCTAQPQFQAVLGEVALCEKALPSPKAAGGAAASKKGGKKAEKKPKAKKAAAPPAAAPKKKAKHPLELLPKSGFNLDAWKKTYSNTTDLYGSAMNYFWEKHDAEGYSVWFMKYKFNEENKVPFMVSNLIGGFVQRCDEIRKYAFGVVQIFGNEAPYTVEGAWLFRGQDVKAMLDCNPDAEYYEWTKVDVNDEEQKKRVATYFCECEKIDGQEVIDCKVFK